MNGMTFKMQRLNNFGCKYSISVPYTAFKEAGHHETKFSHSFYKVRLVGWIFYVARSREDTLCHTKKYKTKKLRYKLQKHL